MDRAQAQPYLCQSCSGGQKVPAAAARATEEDVEAAAALAETEDDAGPVAKSGKHLIK